MMKLITDRIRTGKAPSFEDFVKDFQEKKRIKTASVEEENVKVAEQEEAESSGQLDVEPLHQKGESTEMPKKGPSAKKEAVDTDQPAKVSEEKDEADSSGQPEAEGKLTNNPKVPSKEEKGGETKEEVKEAGIKGICKKCGKPNFLCKGKCDGKAEGDDKGDDKGDDEKDDEKDCKAEVVEVKKAEVEEDKEEKKEKEEEEVKKAQCEEKTEEEKEKEEKEKKESSKKVEFVRFANLDEKNKSFLKKYWAQLFDQDYVNALVAEK